MTLSDTGRAIGAVTRLLRDHLGTKVAEANGIASMDVNVGRPEPLNHGTSTGPKLNLFLYEAHFDEYLKNTPLQQDARPPLWLVLKFLLTAFDEAGESDSPEAHDLLGQGIQALQTLSFLPLNSSYLPPLKDNPNALKITFDESSSDLLHKLMQGSDEKYRFSVCFEVRPIMIATGEAPSYSLLVGIDYTKNSMEEIGEKGIRLSALPVLGPLVTNLSPAKFEVGSTVTIFGENLNLPELTVRLGSLEIPATPVGPDKLQFDINATIVKGEVISAGSHGVSVAQILPNGKKRSGNLSVGNLVPTLTDVTTKSLQRVKPADPSSNIFGNIEMKGLLLGTDQDYISIGLYRDGKTMKVFTEPSVIPSSDHTQTKLKLQIAEKDAVHPGVYRIILNVNGQQARNSPQVDLEIP